MNWYLLGVEMNLGHAHKTKFWYLLGVFSKFSVDEHPVTFIEEYPPPENFNSWWSVVTTENLDLI